MKTYKLSRLFVAYLYGALGLMTLCGLWLFGMVLTGRLGAPAPLLIGWPAMMAYLWLSYLRIPLRIELTPDNSIVFQSAISRKVLLPSDILSIKSMPLSPGFLTVKHSRGKISLISQIDGLYEFITTTKSLNPSIEVRGI